MHHHCVQSGRLLSVSAVAFRFLGFFGIECVESPLRSCSSSLSLFLYLTLIFSCLFSVDILCSFECVVLTASCFSPLRFLSPWFPLFFLWVFQFFFGRLLSVILRTTDVCCPEQCQEETVAAPLVVEMVAACCSWYLCYRIFSFFCCFFALWSCRIISGFLRDVVHALLFLVCFPISSSLLPFSHVVLSTFFSLLPRPLYCAFWCLPFSSASCFATFSTIFYSSSTPEILRQ